MVLGVLSRAVAFTQDGPAVQGADVAPGTEVLYATSGRLTADQHGALQRVARLFAAGQPAEEPRPGQGPAEAGKA